MTRSRWNPFEFEHDMPDPSWLREMFVHGLLGPLIVLVCMLAVVGSISLLAGCR